MSCEPREYANGFLNFRGLKFKIDRRAYITDPETSFLVEQIIARNKHLSTALMRPTTLVEVGLGCASLALSLKHVLKDTVRIYGLEIDRQALDLARENIAEFQLDVEAIESDLFSGLPKGVVPDIVYSDPPWGDHTSLYDDSRDAEYYMSMPPLSAFPDGGKVGMHLKILESLIERSWGSQLLLNLGVLTDLDIEPLFQLTPHARVIRGKYGESVFSCQI